MSQVLANPNLLYDGKLGGLRLVVDSSRPRETMREVSAPYFSVVVLRAIRNPSTKDPAGHMGARLHAIWFSPPQLTAGNPHEWWNLIATSWLSGRVPEDT